MKAIDASVCSERAGKSHLTQCCSTPSICRTLHLLPSDAKANTQTERGRDEGGERKTNTVHSTQRISSRVQKQTEAISQTNLHFGCMPLMNALIQSFVCHCPSVHTNTSVIGTTLFRTSPSEATPNEFALHTMFI